MFGDGSFRHSRLLLFLLFSLLLHLLFVLLVPAPPKQIQGVHRFRLQPLPFLENLKPFLANRPDLPQSTLDRLQAPDFTQFSEFTSFPEIPLKKLPRVTLPLPTTPDPLAVDAKPFEFETPKVVMPDLDELALEGMRQVVEEYEQYLALHRFDADTTDIDSQSRRRARQIVERAIAAMGGRDALLAIKEMHTRVWLEATEHIVPIRGAPPLIFTYPPYPYPLETWNCKNWNCEQKPITVEMSLDRPNEEYTFRNPSRELGRHTRLFTGRWLFFHPPYRQLRQLGERARWHFIDRFLGEGIALDYVDTEKFKGESVEVIRVNDRQYGHYFEAMFSRRTGLLLATKEGLIPEEQKSYRQDFQNLPPVWITVYDRYKPVQGVLTPHRLTRSGPRCPHCKAARLGMNSPITVTLRLQVAYNDRELDPSPPDLDD
jgi:hypothetical protein